MAKSKKRSKRVRVSRSPRMEIFRWTDSRTLIFLAILLVSIVITVIASIQSTRPINFASCNDSGCANVKNGSYWMITNCEVTDDLDGDQQLCAWKGRVGQCGGGDYCCPNSGAQWTKDMSACATPTPKPTNTPNPTSTPRPTNTPNPTSTPRPTNTPNPTSTPRPTNTPYVYRPRATSTPRPTIALTATPTPALADVCGKSCVTDADCKLGLGCTTIFAMLRACRNTLCSDKPGCLCDGGNGAFVFATPTPGPGGAGALRVLLLTVSSFTDKKNQTTQTPSISGTAEPDSKITVTVYPDGIGGEVYADKSGKWTYTFMKKLTAGPKNLLVVATKPDGQAQVAQQFTVVGGGFNFGWILLIMILVAIGFGAYVYIKSNQ